MKHVHLISAQILLVLCVCSRAEESEYRLSCDINSRPYLDTKVGYFMPVPDGFDVEGDPPQRFVSYRSYVLGHDEPIGMSVTIWSEPIGLADYSKWIPLEINHPKAIDIVVKFAQYELTRGSPSFNYVFLKGNMSLNIGSLAPVDLTSVFDCFI